MDEYMYPMFRQATKHLDMAFSHKFRVFTKAKGVCELGLISLLQYTPEYLYTQVSSSAFISSQINGNFIYFMGSLRHGYLEYFNQSKFLVQFIHAWVVCWNHFLHIAAPVQLILQLFLVPFPNCSILNTAPVISSATTAAVLVCSEASPHVNVDVPSAIARNIIS